MIFERLEDVHRTISQICDDFKVVFCKTCTFSKNTILRRHLIWKIAYPAVVVEIRVQGVTVSIHYSTYLPTLWILFSQYRLRSSMCSFNTLVYNNITYLFFKCFLSFYLLRAKSKIIFLETWRNLITILLVTTELCMYVIS